MEKIVPGTPMTPFQRGYLPRSTRSHGELVQLAEARQRFCHQAAANDPEGRLLHWWPMIDYWSERAARHRRDAHEVRRYVRTELLAEALATFAARRTTGRVAA